MYFYLYITTVYNELCENNRMPYITTKFQEVEMGAYYRVVRKNKKKPASWDTQKSDEWSTLLIKDSDTAVDLNKLYYSKENVGAKLHE